MIAPQSGTVRESCKGRRLVRGTGTAPAPRQSRNAAHRYRTSAPGLNHVSANARAARAGRPLARTWFSPGAGVRYRCGAFRLRRGTGAVPVPRSNRLPLNHPLTVPDKVKRVRTHTMTIYAEAKINRKMAPNWP